MKSSKFPKKCPRGQQSPHEFLQKSSKVLKKSSKVLKKSPKSPQFLQKSSKSLQSPQKVIEIPNVFKASTKGPQIILFEKVFKVRKSPQRVFEMFSNLKKYLKVLQSPQSLQYPQSPQSLQKSSKDFSL